MIYLFKDFYARKFIVHADNMEEAIKKIYKEGYLDKPLATDHILDNGKTTIYEYKDDYIIDVYNDSYIKNGKEYNVYPMQPGLLHKYVQKIEEGRQYILNNLDVSVDELDEETIEKKIAELIEGTDYHSYLPRSRIRYAAKNYKDFFSSDRVLYEVDGLTQEQKKSIRSIQEYYHVVIPKNYSNMQVIWTFYDLPHGYNMKTIIHRIDSDIVISYQYFKFYRRPKYDVYMEGKLLRGRVKYLIYKYFKEGKDDKINKTIIKYKLGLTK